MGSKKSRRAGRVAKGGRKESKRSSGGGGTLTSIRGGFKGAVGSMMGEKPKTRVGSLISNIFWILLAAGAVAFLGYRIYKRM